MSERIAIIDLDYVKYGVASVGEERYIEVTHNNSGRVREFPNKTEFCGRNGKAGWLATLNKAQKAIGKKEFPVEEFTIVQKQRISGPVANILHSAKASVERAVKESGATRVEAYLGKGTPFRVELSTLKEYKGNRKDSLKPLRLQEVTDYLQKKFDAVVVENLECDDVVVMRCVELLAQGKDAFIIGTDKDYKSNQVRVYNPDRPVDGVVDCRGVGALWIEGTGSKAKVRGKGFLHKCLQISSEDDIDNYKANCKSNTKWGVKSAYKALKDCKTEAECYQVLVDIFKKLYPEPIEVETWKENTITIDWLYVMQEMFWMAHLWEDAKVSPQWEILKDDLIDVKEKLDHHGINY